MAVAAVAITSCSQPSASHQVATTTASPSAPATQSPVSSPTLTSSPSYPPDIHDLPLTTLNFSCRLPIYKTDATIVGSFIAFPSREVTVDPSGYHGMYYDHAYSRWLPVRRSGVSPDGSHYAYVDYAQTDFVLHVVAVAGGKDVRVPLSSQAFNGQPLVFDYSSDGIYLDNAFEHLLAGLWLVDPTTGSIRQVSRDIYPVFSGGNGIIWTQALNPADSNPVETGTSLGTLANEIDRVDLRTGAQTEWLYERGKGLTLMGLDRRGLPLIKSMQSWNADPNAEMLLVAQPDSPTTIYKDVLVQGIGDGITDSHGTWLGGQFGIYLYTNSGALEKVSDHPGYPANGCF